MTDGDDMDFGLTEEEREFRAALRDLLAAHAHRSTDDSIAAYQPDGPLWSTLHAQLGVGALHVPEAFGGDGLGFATSLVVLHELGRDLTPVPYWGNVAGSWLLQRYFGGPRRDAVLAGIATGESRIGIPRPGQRVDVTAQFSDRVCTLSGTVENVPHGPALSEVIVPVVTASGDTRIVVVGAGDVDWQGVEGVDLLTPLSTGRLDALTVDVEEVSVPLAPHDLVTVLRLFTVPLLVGAAGRCVDEAVSYARDREQFGRPIGSFQAIKHMCVDAHIGVDRAWLALLGLRASLDDEADLAEMALIATAEAVDAYLTAASTNIQVHGGIGFTWEHPAHLFLRDAWAHAAFLGQPSSLDDELADLVL